MSSTPIIKVEGLSKRYILGHQIRHDTLRDSLSHGVRGLIKLFQSRHSHKAQAREDFWALKDVSFEVKRGEVLGIIGRNGAGKSTLLKILSRITEPTEGRIGIRGRIASLLEVGTGFHPELSGRENVFLNGAILGMSRAEIGRKFDEIVAFAEVEKFLDTPVKHYSSGMYTRLAFAVAAHLEPEILIIDEVLAVGDAQFQKKCLGKMQDVSKHEGRTVLLVSHNMAALQAICQTGLMLHQGRLIQRGSIKDSLTTYLGSGQQQVSFTRRDDKPHITSVTVAPESLAEGGLQVDVGFASPFPIAPVIGVVIYNKFGQPITGCNCRMAGETWKPAPVYEGMVSARLQQLPLHSDTYRLSVWLGNAGMDYDEKRDIVEFSFVSPRFHPQAPTTEVTGPLDLSWNWSMRS